MKYLLDTNIISELVAKYPIMDSLIAAICVAKKFILVTRNEKDFKSLNIDILNPFEDNLK